MFVFLQPTCILKNKLALRNVSPQIQKSLARIYTKYADVHKDKNMTIFARSLEHLFFYVVPQVVQLFQSTKQKIVSVTCNATHSIATRLNSDNFSNKNVNMYFGRKKEKKIRKGGTVGRGILLELQGSFCVASFHRILALT